MGGLRTKKNIYVLGVLPHLESTPLGWVEHQEAFEEVLAVSGHVERDAVLPSEDALPQLLHSTAAALASDVNRRIRAALVDGVNQT